LFVADEHIAKNNAVEPGKLSPFPVRACYQPQILKEMRHPDIASLRPIPHSSRHNLTAVHVFSPSAASVRLRRTAGGWSVTSQTGALHSITAQLPIT